MPLYEYFCSTCRAKFEQLRPMSNGGEPATCPRGHGGAQRVLSAFASVVKGSGGDVDPAPSAGCGCGGGGCACRA